MKNWILVVFLLAVVLMPVFASGTETLAAAKTGAEWVKTEIYLGKESLAGYEISRLQFTKFMDSVVTKEFPKGFTLYETYGQMQEPDGSITKQETWVIVIAHEKTEENNKAVEVVIDEYRKQFMNAEVMRTTSPIEVKFYTNK